MFLHLSVSHSVHWGLPQCMLGYTPRTRGRHPPRTRGRPPGADTPWEQCMLGETGNKLAVYILLECIFVANFFLGGGLEDGTLVSSRPILYPEIEQYKQYVFNDQHRTGIIEADSHVGFNVRY